MGRQGISRLDEGMGEFLHSLETYYDAPTEPGHPRLADYLERKARAKARRYNVRMRGDVSE
jgi:hypothetical protein